MGWKGRGKMNGYILNKEGIEKEEKHRLYRQGELELMTTHQLREICRQEKIIQGKRNLSISLCVTGEPGSRG